MTLWRGYVNFRMKVILLMATLMSTMPHLFALEHFEFRQGTNASVSFHQELSASSAIFELFTLSQSLPFYVNGGIDPTSIHPDQVGRLKVRSQQNGHNLIVTLEIQNIQETDSDVYIVAITEMEGGQAVNHIHDAYISVLPGMATCNVTVAPFSPEWREIRCEATAGNDNSGTIRCYQNHESQPLTGESGISKSLLYGVFLVHVDCFVSCCSTQDAHATEPSECFDFVYNATDTSSETSVRTEQVVTKERTSTEVTTLKDAIISKGIMLNHDISEVSSGYSDACCIIGIVLASISLPLVVISLILHAKSHLAYRTLRSKIREFKSESEIIQPLKADNHCSV